MASNLNHVTLSGHVTRDSELSFTQSKTSVLRFCIASNESRKGADGQWSEFPNFVDCVLFGKRAEKLDAYINKGDLVAVVGRLHYSSWEKDGQKRNKLEVIVDDVQLCGGGRSQQGAGAQPDAGIYDEEIPF